MPSLPRIALILFLGTLPTLSACKQGIDQRCQLDSDCQSSLQCVLPAGGDVQEGGTCQPRSLTDIGVLEDIGASDASVADQRTEGGTAADSGATD